ncbi:hypothetical protein EHS13_06040 [Paenibacillus psychroresistens]|uniref:Uncharacterized protein n=1 Tax=Paenibacillus psychroresistens TaxID=1778678 RepID=A0A6B8RGK1_9BACL|nr:DUF4097 family beta strand repeat-containing protein [Paenibacillus psychroresistens]QGQ94496.1 hypothetical protein EHS13_06040 [Paenibacillus psychroresistens]
MKTWKIGSGTLSIGLIGIGVLLLLNYSGLITNEFFQYAGPIYIILFGIEVIWSYFRSSEKRQGFSSWSIIILFGVFITSSTHMVFPSNFDWQPRFLSVIEGNAPLENGIKNVEISIPNGKVEVVGTTENVISYAGELLVNAKSQEQANENIKSQWKVEQDGDTLKLILEQAGPKWNLFSIFDWTQKSPHVTVEIPQSLLTKIKTSNGSVNIKDMNGDAEIKTSNGTITVLNMQGNVKADTSNGSATFTDVKGSLEIETNNGSLTLNQISGSVKANTSNGSIKGSSIISGDWECITSNGRITLAIPENADAEIKADTSNGSVGGDMDWQDGEKTHRSSKLNAGTHEITLKSSNGSINVDYADETSLKPIAPLAPLAPLAP